jgi:SAM-dependent methyltransferase
MNISKQISQIDINNLKIIRESVDNFFKKISAFNDNFNNKILEIAPQPNNSISQYIKYSTVHTLDIDLNSKATYIADLCKNNSYIIPDNSYEIIVCTEVLEHTLNPFEAANEIYRILKPGGKIFVSTPFNLRIHGPLPDCWRFTEHGLKELFKKFKNINIESTDDDRFLMPIHYKLIAEK